MGGEAVQPPGFAEIQQVLAQVLPQPLNAFRRQGDEALITARHHHGQAVVITIRKFAGHGGSVPSGFAREKLRLNLRGTREFDEPVKRTIGAEP
jgi:hypothetical protein